MRNFFLGMLYPLKGIKYLLTPGLKRFILLPLAFNLMMFVGLFYLVQHFVLPYAYYYLDKLPSWLSFLSSVLFIIFVLSYFLMFLSLFTVFFNLAAAPFNGLLSERTQNLLFQSTIPPIPFHKMVIRSIKRQGEFLGYFLPRFLIMGILFFIPLLQPIYPFYGFFLMPGYLAFNTRILRWIIIWSALKTCGEKWLEIKCAHWDLVFLSI